MTSKNDTKAKILLLLTCWVYKLWITTLLVIYECNVEAKDTEYSLGLYSSIRIFKSFPGHFKKSIKLFGVEIPFYEAEICVQSWEWVSR